MSGRTIALLLAFVICRPALADPPKAPPDKPSGKSAPKQDDKAGDKDKKTRPPKNLAVKAMRMVIKDAEFEDMTFEEFTEWLSRTTKANVVVRWKLLEKEGIERDYPITLKRKDVRVRKLLLLVFDMLTEDLRSVELAAKADGNTIIISTRKDINTKRITVVYDVQDLLIVVPNFTGPGIGELGVGKRKGFQISGSGGGGGGKGRKEKKTRDPVQQLIDAITTHIQPLSWKVNGGKGTIVHYKGQLVIYNNVEVHNQLAIALGAKKDKP
jgi:hypothetical protein